MIAAIHALRVLVTVLRPSEHELRITWRVMEGMLDTAIRLPLVPYMNGRTSRCNDTEVPFEGTHDQKPM